MWILYLLISYGPRMATGQRYYYQNQAQCERALKKAHAAFKDPRIQLLDAFCVDTKEDYHEAGCIDNNVVGGIGGCSR